MSLEMMEYTVKVDNVLHHFQIISETYIMRPVHFGSLLYPNKEPKCTGLIYYTPYASS